MPDTGEFRRDEVKEFGEKPRGGRGLEIGEDPKLAEVLRRSVVGGRLTLESGLGVNELDERW